MPKSDGVLITNKKNTILEATRNNQPLQDFLMSFAGSSLGIAIIRKFCSFTREDWLCYIACMEYEPLKNRDEADREDLTNCGKNWGTPEESRLLTEELFNEIKDEFPLAKKLTHDLYYSLRFRDKSGWNSYDGVVYPSHLEQLQFIRQPPTQN